MNTLAWILILVGVLIARAVSKGRVMNVGEDAGDAFLAVVQGDTAALTEVLARTGESNQASWVGLDEAVAQGVGGVVGGFEGVGGAIGGVKGAIGDQAKANGVNGLAFAAVMLGEKAKGYRWEATGPDYYDCSGLMWRACQKLGYKGSRFTTATVRSRKGFKLIDAASAGVDDMVLWPAGSGGLTGHIGVMTNKERFYSARSVRSGIGEASIAGFRSTKPLYLRYVGE